MTIIPLRIIGIITIVSLALPILLLEPFFSQKPKKRPRFSIKGDIRFPERIPEYLRREQIREAFRKKRHEALQKRKNEQNG
jgi:hypothetical protein